MGVAGSGDACEGMTHALPGVKDVETPGMC